MQNYEDKHDCVPVPCSSCVLLFDQCCNYSLFRQHLELQQLVAMSFHSTKFRRPFVPYYHFKHLTPILATTVLVLAPDTPEKPMRFL